MVTVPRKTVNEISQAPDRTPLQRIETGDTGQASARAIQNASNALQRASQQTDQIGAQLQMREDETRLLDYQTKLQEYETNRLYTADDAILNRKGDQAFGSTSGTLKDFDSFAAELDKGLTSERQRQQAKRIRFNVQNSLARTVSRHEASQRRVWESSVRAAAIEKARDRAVLYFSDDQERNESIKNLKQLVREDNPGMPQEVIDQQIENEVTSLHASIIDRYAIDDPDAAKKYFNDHKDEMDPDSHNRILKAFNVIDRQAQAAARQEIQSQINVIQDAYKLGLEVPKSQVDGLASLAEKHGMDKQAEALNIMQDVFDNNKEFLDLPLKQQAEGLNTLRAAAQENPTKKSLAEYSMLQSSFQEKMKQLSTDPLTYYQKRGDMRQFKQLDLSNPAKFTYEINQRRLAVHEVSQKDGIQLPLMTKNEMDVFSDQYAQASAEGKTQMLNTFSQTFGPDESRLIAQKIAPKQKSMAAVMSIIHEAPGVAEKIAAGSTRDKFVSRTKIAAQLQEDLEGAVQDGVAMESITDSVYDLYAQMSFEENDTTNELDTDRLQAAYEQVLGPKLKITSGFFDATPSHILPFRMNTGQFISEGQFDGALSALDLETILRTHGDTFKTPDGLNLDVQETIGRTKLVTVGDGKYELHTRTGQQIVGSDPSRPFVLDMKKIVNEEATKGVFGSIVDRIGKSDIDKYVDIQRQIKEAQDEGAPDKKINALKNKLDLIKLNEQIREMGKYE